MKKCEGHINCLTCENDAGLQIKIGVSFFWQNFGISLFASERSEVPIDLKFTFKKNPHLRFFFLIKKIDYRKREERRWREKEKERSCLPYRDQTRVNFLNGKLNRRPSDTWNDIPIN